MGKSGVTGAIFAILLILTALTLTASIITLVKVWDVNGGGKGGDGGNGGGGDGDKGGDGGGGGGGGGDGGENKPDPPKGNELNIPEAMPIDNESPKYQVFADYVTLIKETNNAKQKPCSNFYEYVCDRKTGSGLADLRKKADEVLDAAMENMPRFDAMDKLKALRDKCIANLEEPVPDDTNGLKFKTLFEAFKRVVKVDFPALNPVDNSLAKPDKTTLAQIILHLSNRNGNAFTRADLAPIVAKDMPDRSQSIVFSEPEIYAFSVYSYKKSSSQIKDEVKLIFKDNVQKIAVVQGVRDRLTEAQLEEDAAKVADLDSYIGNKVVYDPTVPRTWTAKIKFYKAADATSQLGLFDYRAFLTGYVDGQPNAVKNRVLNDDYQFAVTNPEGIKNLADHLASNQVSARTIYNYIYAKFVDIYDARLDKVKTKTTAPLVEYEKMNSLDMTKMVRSNVPFSLSEPQESRTRIRSKDQDVYMSGITADRQDEIRRQACSARLLYSNLFAPLMNRLYIDKVIPNAADRKAKYDVVKEITQNIIDGFRAQISQLGWTPSAKSLAYKKLDNIQVNIGFPENVLDNEVLNLMFEDIKLDAFRTYRDEIEQIKLAMLKKEIRQLSGTVRDRKIFPQRVTNAKAVYDSRINAITIPDAILYPPFFHKDFPLAALYGSLGAVLGNAIVHGFDANGVEFDENGVLSPWLDNTSKAKFDEMAKCVVDQYSAFKVKSGQNVNGAFTQDENIADNGGIRAAYTAYKFHQANIGDDPRLPSDDLKHITPDQLFFIAFTREVCNSMEYGEDMLNTDNQSPPKYRVFGTLQNFPPFKSAFNCKVTDPYAEQQCVVFAKK